MVHVTNGLGEQHLCKAMYRYIGVQFELDDWFVGVHVCLCTSLHSHSITNMISIRAKLYTYTI